MSYPFKDGYKPITVRLRALDAQDNPDTQAVPSWSVDNSGAFTVADKGDFTADIGIADGAVPPQAGTLTGTATDPDGNTKSATFELTLSSGDVATVGIDVVNDPNAPAPTPTPTPTP